MRYLTQEWYELCQRRGLHFGMRVHRGAAAKDEALYTRLYARKEKAYLKLEREIYDVDPRFMLEHDGAELVSARALSGSGEIKDEDIIIYRMPPEEKLHIEKLIADYDVRPPFDVTGSKYKFKEIHGWSCEDQARRLSGELYEQIADIRVFTLGYCTKEVLHQLKRESKANESQTGAVMSEYRSAQQAEAIPDHIKDKFHFHDCTVTGIHISEDMVIRLDTDGGFTHLNQITLLKAEILRQDAHVPGSSWLYEELYVVNGGYEVHVLLSGAGGMQELIVRCKDIVLEES
ncbi:DUF4085 family protein [Paenibacillus sp. MMS20-IR301]|uniref:DUF4085 family protein n=1 Tax=Paenibacillus sp. MMS20-IR301 TaxID=2895946 RepID=UPI0028EA35AC|nr:DUF4085 family protein [Paenibacillus sp. MMS20-IR301]WNS44714.1 DUF4085 family protein [Paenibacillus sp. MMS20-IR301]